MSEGEASGGEGDQNPPFTPEQLNWIDRLIAARSNGPHLDNHDEVVTTSAAPGPIVTMASTPGEPVHTV